MPYMAISPSISLCLCVLVVISRALILSSGILESQYRSGLLLSHSTMYNITSI